MEILILNPPSPEPNWCLEHLGMAYIAAVLREKGHNVRLLDASPDAWDVKQTYQVIRNNNEIDLLGITAMDPYSFQKGVDVVTLLRNEGLKFHVTAGGHFPTHWSQEILEKYAMVDSVVVGEGEETISELIDSLEKHNTLSNVLGLAWRSGGTIVQNPPRPLITNLDQIPFPDRDYLSAAYQRYYAATVYSSRGCPQQCSFCSIPTFYRRSPGKPYRSRSAKNIVDEVETLLTEHNVRFILFIDDEFLGGSQYRRRILLEVIDEIRKRQLDFGFGIQYRADFGDDIDLLRELKKVGLVHAFIGVESGVDSMLKRFEKGFTTADIQKALRIAQELELNLVSGYLIFDPWTTFQELRQNVGYLLEPYSPLVLNIHPMGIVKGTHQETALRKQGLLIERELIQGYSIRDPKVVSFNELLGVYYPTARQTALEIYKLLFLAGNFPQTDREAAVKEEIKLQKKLQHYHQQFLAKAVAELSQNKMEGGIWLDDFKEAYQSLYAEVNELVDAWVMMLGLV